MHKFSFYYMLFCFFSASLLYSQTEYTAFSNIQDPVNMRSESSFRVMSLSGPIDSNYSIGPGDIFELYAENQLIPLQVSPQSTVLIDNVGIISLRSLTYAQARQKILDAVGSYYHADKTDIHLVFLKNVMVSIYGAIRSSGQFAISPTTRLSLLIRQAGGIVSGSDIENILIIRGQDTLKVNYSLTERTGNLQHDPILAQGDVVIIPDIQEVNDLVYLRMKGQIIPLRWEKHKTIDEYMRRAEVYKDIANYSRIFVYSKGQVAPEIISLGQSPKITVEPGTMIELIVQKMFVYVGGSTARLGNIEYTPGYTASDYLASAGLSIVSADFNRLKIIRSNGNSDKIDPFSDRIYPGDTIILPKSRYEMIKDFTLFLGTLMGIAATYLTITRRD